MIFENVYHLLSWYFKRKWQKGPKLPGNHKMVYVDAITPLLGAETVYDMVMKIDEVCSLFPERDVLVLDMLFNLFEPCEVAKKRGVSERRVRQIRRSMLGKMKILFEELGLFGRDKIFTSEVRLAIPSTNPLPAS